MSRPDRNRCNCGQRAIYRRRWGGFTARGDHPLCPRCWRSELDRTRAAQPRAAFRTRSVLPHGIVLPEFLPA